MQLNDSYIQNLMRSFERRADLPEFALWMRKVWYKHAIKSRDYNASLATFSAMIDSPRGFLTPMPWTDRFYVSKVDTEYDRYEIDYLNVTVTCVDGHAPRTYEQFFGPGNGRYALDVAHQPVNDVKIHLRLKYNDYHFAMKDGLLFVGGGVATGDLTDILDWWRSGPAIPKDLTRLSVAQAKASVEKWHKVLAKSKPKCLSADDKVALGSLEIVYQVHTSDGEPFSQARTYEVFKLTTERALSAEGASMCNCLGSYTNLLLHGDLFFSVQGKDRSDSFTVHALHTKLNEFVLLQARGFANRTLTQSEEAQLVAGLRRLVLD